MTDFKQLPNILCQFQDYLRHNIEDHTILRSNSSYVFCSLRQQVQDLTVEQCDVALIDQRSIFVRFRTL